MCVVKNPRRNSIPDGGAILRKWPDKHEADVSIFMPFIRRIPTERGGFKFEGEIQEESLVSNAKEYFERDWTGTRAPRDAIDVRNWVRNG